MKTPLLLGLFMSCVGVVSAQQDPVLMRINGSEVLRSEFEYIYRDAKSREKKVLESQADSLVLFKLKVAAAEAAGMDKQPGFRKEQVAYRLRLTKMYLLGEEEHTAGQPQELAWVSHLFFKLPQTVSSYRLQAAEVRMDSLYRALINNPQTDFSRLVAKYSDDKETLCINRLQMPEEFERVAFEVPVGEISKPFFTPQGIHLLKVLKRETASLNAVDTTRTQAFWQRYVVSGQAGALIENLKRDNGFVSDPAGAQELLKTGKTDKALFSLNGRSYTGKDFERFAAGYPRSVKRQYDAFVAKTVLDVANNNLEQKHPELQLALKGHGDSLLVSLITRQELLGAQRGDAELAAYFTQNKSDYKWNEPRFKGVVLHCADKKTSKMAKKLLKEFPEEEWKTVVRKAFNTPTEEVVKVEQGVFTEGSNPYVDKLVFKSGSFAPVPSYPYTSVVGKKQKAPDSWEEVREQLVVDYRNYLDRQWVDRLRARSKVEINEEVLKTVNNH